MADEIKVLEFLLSKNEETNREPFTENERFYIKGQKDLIKEILHTIYGKEIN